LLGKFDLSIFHEETSIHREKMSEFRKNMLLFNFRQHKW